MIMKKLGDIREIFKSAKHSRPKAIFCPRCASPRINLSSSLAVWLTPKQYYCAECGYLGILVMELEKDDSQTDDDTGKDE